MKEKQYETQWEAIEYALKEGYSVTRDLVKRNLVEAGYCAHFPGFYPSTGFVLTRVAVHYEWKDYVIEH